MIIFSSLNLHIRQLECQFFVDVFHGHCSTENISLKTPPPYRLCVQSSGVNFDSTWIFKSIKPFFFFGVKENISVRDVFIADVLFLFLEFDFAI